MKLLKMHWIGMIVGAAIIVGSIVAFWDSPRSNIMFFLLGLGVVVGVFPFMFAVTLENKRQREMSDRFLEFSRNLSESVSTGTPISRSIINMGRKNYGVLSPYIIKLANQIALGIPVNYALQTFAHDLNNPVISRSVALMSEAERAGGEIDYILDSVSKSIAEVEKLRGERRAAIAGLVVQGYIIFFIFIAIMMIMEFNILPLSTEISLGGAGGDLGAVLGGGEGVQFNAQDHANLFLYLLLSQGFFTGLVIGKLAEGSLPGGIKHSFIMMTSAFLISNGARLFFGTS